MWATTLPLYPRLTGRFFVLYWYVVRETGMDKLSCDDQEAFDSIAPPTRNTRTMVVCVCCGKYALSQLPRYMVDVCTFRIMERFAERYHEENPGVFSCAETAWVLAFGLMILNTDMYNRNIKVSWWDDGQLAVGVVVLLLLCLVCVSF